MQIQYRANIIGYSTVEKPGYSHFRLYFRELYGANQFKPGILFDRSSDPLKCLIVRRIRLAPRDRKIPSYPFAEPIALELAAQIGCNVPKTKIVKFFINTDFHAFN